MAIVELMDRQVPTWKSPLRKLARFFGRSRDRWKAKYAALKKSFKLLVNQVRAVEKSREKWNRMRNWPNSNWTSCSRNWRN